ncbi:MAG: phosphoribosylanthranilate isomerase [Desulfobacterota bacterium]|nr:phosphoribosylanthranilate isomerase [Thermodesulfobacteriota bacterium]
MMKTYIKICGITTIDDARIVEDAGADYIGIIVDIAGSPRSVTVKQAARLRAACLLPVIILADMPPEPLRAAISAISPDGVQLIGFYTEHALRDIRRTTPCSLWHTLPIPPMGVAADITELHETLVTYSRTGVDVVVCDTSISGKKGGTGITANWDVVKNLVGTRTLPIFLAGGITPDNVVEAMHRVRPCGIDVSSGVEQAPGVKDVRKTKRLIAAVRNYEAQTAGVH